MRDAKLSTHNALSTQNKKQLVESNLNKDTLSNFANFKAMENNLIYKEDSILDIDENAKNFLRNTLNIDIGNM